MSTHDSYRADIDGLRAVAVSLVVLHHIAAPLLPGGYVGVDIFFVISGFLITGQIAGAVSRGQFSFRDFYKRRINRIVPPALVVISATLVLGLFSHSPNDYQQLARSAIFALLGLSNIYFWREYGNYFGGDSSEAPLLHTWSLGVEEQFYLVWPALALVLLKLEGKWRTGLLVVLLCIGTALSQAGLSIAASASYYLLPTRFFELLLGAALALVPISKGTAALRFAASGAGYVLIGAAAFMLDKQSSFPGVNALWPCLGTALLLWSGGMGPQSAPAVVRLGELSYSLYLWHWPIIALLGYRGIAMTVPVGMLVIAVAIGLSWITWTYVEKPARAGGNMLPFPRVLLTRFLVPVGSVAVFAGIALSLAGFPGRFDDRVATLEIDALSRPEELRRGCHVPTALYATEPNAEKCRLGARKQRPEAILIGDSYANHFTGMLDVIASHENVAVLDYTMDGCPPLLGYETARGGSYAHKCKSRNEAAFRYVQREKLSHVILAASWPDDEAAAVGMFSSVKAAINAGATVTIVLKNQKIDGAGHCVVRAAMMGRSDSHCKTRQSGNPSYIDTVRALYPSVRIIDPNTALCTDGWCATILNGRLAYRDSGHLNDIGSREIGRELVKRASDRLLNAH